jgi:hypothetical protein
MIVINYFGKIQIKAEIPNLLPIMILKNYKGKKIKIKKRLTELIIK